LLNDIHAKLLQASFIFSNEVRLPFKAQWLFYVPPVLTFKILRSAHTVHLCLFQWPQNRASISLYIINCLEVYNRDRERLLRGTNWIFKYYSS